MYRHNVDDGKTLFIKEKAKNGIQFEYSREQMHLSTILFLIFRKMANCLKALTKKA